MRARSPIGAYPRMHVKPPRDRSNNPRSIIDPPSSDWPQERRLEVCFGLFPQRFRRAAKAPRFDASTPDLRANHRLHARIWDWNKDAFQLILGDRRIVPPA